MDFDSPRCSANQYFLWESIQAVWNREQQELCSRTDGSRFMQSAVDDNTWKLHFALARVFAALEAPSAGELAGAHQVDHRVIARRAFAQIG